MHTRLSALCEGYSGERYQQLLYCVCIRYIRKAALETPAILSITETERVISKALESLHST